MGAEQSVHPLDPLPKTEQVGSRTLVILPSAPSQTGSAPVMVIFWEEGGGGCAPYQPLVAQLFL